MKTRGRRTRVNSKNLEPRDVFTYRNYAAFVRDRIDDERAERGRGITRSLAEAAAVHTTFISQVINEKAAFSIEQALAFCRFFRLSAAETEFFVELVGFARAGTPEARIFFEKRIAKLQKAHSDLKSRWSDRNQTLGTEEAAYFGSWTTQVVHAALQLKECSTVEGLTSYLGFSERDVQFSLEMLRDMNLAKLVHRERDSTWSTTTRFLHLGKDSPMIRYFHLQWRNRVTQEFLSPSPTEGFHYSGALTFSKNDAPAVKAILIEALDRIMKTIEPSAAEDVYGLNLDLFSLEFHSRLKSVRTSAN